MISLKSWHFPDSDNIFKILPKFEKQIILLRSIRGITFLNEWTQSQGAIWRKSIYTNYMYIHKIINFPLKFSMLNKAHVGPSEMVRVVYINMIVTFPPFIYTCTPYTLKHCVYTWFLCTAQVFKRLLYMLPQLITHLSISVKNQGPGEEVICPKSSWSG